MSDSGWHEVKLEEIASLHKETILPQNFAGDLYLGLEHIEPGGTLSLLGRGSPQDVTSNKNSFHPDDILYGKLRPYFRKIWMAEEEGICSTDIWVVRANTELVVPNFLKYILLDKRFDSFVMSAIKGTNLPRADWKSASKYRVDLPSLKQQQAIAEILSSLDDRIEHNNKLAALLEANAQALYESWFVRFDPVHAKMRGEVPRGVDPDQPMDKELADLFPDKIDEQTGLPEGWEQVSFTDLADVQYGFPFKSDLFAETGDYPVVRIRDVLSSSTNTYTSEQPKPDYKIENGEVVVGMDGNFHQAVWASSNDCYLNQRVLKAKSKSDTHLSNLYLHLYLDKKVKWLNSIIGGTTVPHLGAKHIDELVVDLPPASIRKNTETIFNDFLGLIVKAKVQNAFLSQTRDHLLPRLISGKISLDKAEKKASKKL